MHYKVWLDEIKEPSEVGQMYTYIFSKKDHGAFLEVYSEKDKASEVIVKILEAFND